MELVEQMLAAQVAQRLYAEVGEAELVGATGARRRK